MIEANRGKENDGLNLRYARIATKKNLPLRLQEDKEWLDWLRDVSRFPLFQPATRQNLSEYYMPRLADAINRKFLKLVEQSDEYFMSIEFDHWSDSQNWSILGISAT